MKHFQKRAQPELCEELSALAVNLFSHAGKEGLPKNGSSAASVLARVLKERQQLPYVPDIDRDLKKLSK